jgi:membrane protease YdiL (CAAX protease family)
VYSLTLWWMIWSPTEEATYQAYVLPRLQALTGRTWIAFLIVGVCWTAQHCALPFVPDWRFLLFRFLAFLPGVLVLMLIYLRTRRLTPLIVAHWPMDIVAAIMTAAY